MGGRLVSSLAVLVCLLVFQPQGGRAEQGEAQTAMPDAVAALERMGEHLKTLNQFTLGAATTSEDVLDFDEKVMIGGNITYRVKIPDRLNLTIKTDKREREYFYDGKTVTVYAPALKYYSVFPASDTIAKTIEEAESTYGVEVPLADLFYLGTKGSKADASNIISAFYVSELDDQWNRLRPLRLPHGDSEFPGLDSKGGRTASVQDRQRHPRRSGTTAVHGGAHLEPR